MNHFELFGIPVSFQTDAVKLKERLEQLKEQYRQEEKNKTPEQEGSEHRTTRLEHAYKVLSDEEALIPYVLKLLHQLDDPFEPDPEFRLEVSDLEQELMELELDERKELLFDVEQKAERLMLKTYDDVAEVIQTYREDTGTEEELLQVKEFYHKKKFLQRILDRIKVIRNIASPQ